MTVRRLLILARTYRDFKNFCHDHDLNPHSRDIIYISEPDKLRGYSDHWIINLGPSLPEGVWDFYTEVMKLVPVHGFNVGTRSGMGGFWSPWWCFCGASGTGADDDGARLQYEAHLRGER